LTNLTWGNKLRLSKKELHAIISIFQKYFEKEDHLWLFGSRVDPNRKGGDIDLYIETKERNSRVLLERKIYFSGEIKLKIGDQKIDVIINNGKNDLAIYKEARATGILLV
jgi:hypothetical protein